MTVPTPLTWSTWTAMQRRVAGQSIVVIWPLVPPVSVAVVIWAPFPTACRAI